MRSLRLVLILFFVAFPLMSFAAKPEGKKATTIDELAKMYDVSSCKECHAKIFEEWEHSAHSMSLIGSDKTASGTWGYINRVANKYKHSGANGLKGIKVSHFMDCMNCHLPQLKDATDEVAQELIKAYDESDWETLGKVRVNCLVCHNLKAIIHKWQDGEPEPGVIYGTKEGKHPDKVYKTMKKSPVIKEAVMCGQCHGLGPTLQSPQPSQCATLYGSYLHAYIPAGGTETCQDCHMKGASHRWPGFITQGETVLSQPNRAFDVEVVTKAYQFLERKGNLIPKANVTVKITNKAGHRIPDA